jgi:hypothetical protein
MTRPRGEKEGRRGRGSGRGGATWCGGGCRAWPRPAGVRDVRRAVVASRTEERRRGLTGGPRHSAGRRCP